MQCGLGSVSPRGALGADTSSSCAFVEKRSPLYTNRTTSLGHSARSGTRTSPSIPPSLGARVSVPATLACVSTLHIASIKGMRRTLVLRESFVIAIARALPRSHTREGIEPARQSSLLTTYVPTRYILSIVHNKVHPQAFYSESTRDLAPYCLAQLGFAGPCRRSRSTCVFLAECAILDTLPACALVSSIPVHTRYQMSTRIEAT